MTNATFLWKNLWNTGTLTYSSQHSNFPASNTRHRHHTRVWRPNYDAASGWGTFVIAAGVNDKIDFDEGGGELTGTLTPGTYDADTLATEIKTQMDVAGALTYTVEYLDASNKFKISATGAFTIRWATGTNTATSVGTTIGFDITANDTGTDNYTADYIRIHSEEWLKVDMGQTQAIKAFCFKKHNFQSNAQVRIQGHASDAWGSPSVNQLLSLSADITIYFWVTAQNYRWWRYYMQDASNPDGYVETGRCFAGGHFSPTVNCERGYLTDFVDPSDVNFSDGGQITSSKKTKYEKTSYLFNYATAADLASFFEMFDELGRSGNLFFTLDRDSASTTTRYVRFAKNLRKRHIIRDEQFSIQVIIEDLR